MPRTMTNHWTADTPALRWPPRALGADTSERALCARCLGTGHVARPGFAGVQKYRTEQAQIPCPECHAAGRVLREISG